MTGTHTYTIRIGNIKEMHSLLSFLWLSDGITDTGGWRSWLMHTATMTMRVGIHSLVLYFKALVSNLETIHLFNR